MYNHDIIKARINYLCELKKTTQKKLLSDLGYGVNLLRQSIGERGLSGVALYDIADYFGVSIDYLVGRTDKPEVNR